MATELEKSHREKNYWESEIVSLRKEFDDLNETNELVPRSKGQSKEKKPKQEKMRALDDIQHLIKKFRQNE
jgi:hypothetical protein